MERRFPDDTRKGRVADGSIGEGRAGGNGRVQLFPGARGPGSV
jgi:hypothetical protein